MEENKEVGQLEVKKPLSKTEKLLLLALFIFSFVFFVYLTFPFGVLKEALTASINKSSTMTVRIGSLSPNFPLGVDLKDVTLSKAGSSRTLTISQASVEIGVFSILMGRLRIDVTLQDRSKGELYAQLRFGLWSFIRGQASLPSYVELKSEKYPIGSAFDFGLSLIDFGPSYQQFLGSYLEKLAFKGILDANLNLDINASQPSESSGKIDIKLTDGSFSLLDPSLNIDPQIFSRFLLKGAMQKGVLKLEEGSGLTSQDVLLDIQGGVNLQQRLEMSQVDVNLSYKMQGSMQREIGGILDGLLGATNGTGKFHINGPIIQLRTAKM